MAPLEIFSISVSIGKEKCSRHPADPIRWVSGRYARHKHHQTLKFILIFSRIMLFVVTKPVQIPAYQARWVSRTLLLLNTHRNTEEFEGRHNVIFVENTKATVRRCTYPPISGTAVAHSYLVFLVAFVLFRCIAVSCSSETPTRTKMGRDTKIRTATLSCKM